MFQQQIGLTWCKRSSCIKALGIVQVSFTCILPYSFQSHTMWCIKRSQLLTEWWQKARHCLALVKTGLFCIKLSDVTTGTHRCHHDNQPLRLTLNYLVFFFFSRLRFDLFGITHAKNSQSMYNKGQLIQRRETLNAITGHSSALVKYLWVYLMYYWCILNIPTTK